MLNDTIGVTPVSDIGVGYNTFLSSARSKVVNVQYKDTSHSSGSNVYVCTSTEDVYHALGIKSEIAVGTSWGSFQAKMDFASSLQTHSLSITILVLAFKVVSGLTATSVNFIDPSPVSAIDLFKVAGDSYVSNIQTGGQYIASYNFVAQDQESYQQLSTSVAASFGRVSTFDSRFETSMTDIQSKSNVTYSFNQLGIGLSTTTYPSPDQFTQFVLHFNDVPLDGPEILGFATESYSTVKGAPDFKQIDIYRETYVNPILSNDGISDTMLRAKSILPVISDVATIYGFYGMQYLELAVSKDPTNPKIPPPVIQKDLLLIPTPEYGLTMGQKAGGGGGSSFQDVTVDDIKRGIIPTKISFQGHGYLDNIWTWYTYQDTGKSSFDRKHGGDGGIAPYVIDLGTKGNKITYLSAVWDDYVDKMTTATTLNPAHVTYPTNDNGRNQVEWTFPKNSAFVGWSGSSGGYVDSIQPLFATFSLCKWDPLKPNIPKK
ncbi:hypothetical protein DL95DRAFT_412716 [Leptodontidium sp. 2 PMI_412]|nr:hypothetical protein DL95DRAFT_412716 [Leptodontidium sp. 2 PMI_412]